MAPPAPIPKPTMPLPPDGKARPALAGSATQDATLDDIYRALQRGAGRELVDDGNAGALIERAREHGDVQLEYLLREWRSPCGDDPDAPDLAQVQGNPPPR
jgi:hypothetical protein